VSIAAVPSESHGKPVNSVARSHSARVHSAGMTSAARTAGGARNRASSAPASERYAASTTQKAKVAKAASGAGMAPKRCRLMYTQDTPARYIPMPKRKPVHAAARGPLAPSHRCTSTASAASASGNHSRGA
jgi:hypothetical protein